MTRAAYDELTRTWKRLHHFGHLQSMASWDRSAMMPVSGSAARADDTDRTVACIACRQADRSPVRVTEMGAGEPPTKRLLA